MNSSIKAVRTTYTGCPYITAGKVYPVIKDSPAGFTYPSIFADDGWEISICFTKCPHLDDHAWETLDHIPEDSDRVAQLEEHVRVLREALKALCHFVDRNTCRHDETRRGGAIWEICDQCGAKWADDEGGKPAFILPSSLTQAYAALESTKGEQK